MSYEEFAKLFEGMSLEQIEAAGQFLKLWHEASPEHRQAMGEILAACEQGTTLGEALNSVSNVKIRERLIEHAKDIGVYDTELIKATA